MLLGEGLINCKIFVFKSSVIRQKGETQTGDSRKESTPNFPKNEHFLPPVTHTYVRNVKKTVTGVFFPNYQNSNDATEAYYDFIQKIMVAIDKVAPIKERTINIIPRNGLTVKFLKQSKIFIIYLENLKDRGYISIRNFIMRLDIRYIR